MSTTSIREKETIKIGEVAIESIKKIQMGSQRPNIIIGHRNKGACIYELSQDLASYNSKIIKSFGKHRKSVTDAIYASGTDKAIVASGESVNIHDLSTKEFFDFKCHKRNITSVTINRDNNKIVTGSQDCSINLFNSKGKLIKTLGEDNLVAHKGWVNQVQFIPGTDDLLASCSDDGSVKIWDVESGALLKTFIKGNLVDTTEGSEYPKTTEENAIKSFCLSNDGSVLVYGGRDSIIYVINLATDDLLQVFNAESRVTAIASGEIQPLIAVAVPNKIQFWNIIESKFVGEYVFSEKGEVYCYSIIFNGDEIVAGLSTGILLRLEISRN